MLNKEKSRFSSGKKLILTIAIILSFTSGFSSVSVAELSSNSATLETSTALVYIRVFENGAIWVYVYEEDGTFVAKYLETIN